MGDAQYCDVTRIKRTRTDPFWSVKSRKDVMHRSEFVQKRNLEVDFRAVFEPAKTLHNACKNPSFLAKTFKILANFAKFLKKLEKFLQGFRFIIHVLCKCV